MKNYPIILILIIVFPMLCLAGTDHYVDPEANSGGNGSLSRPWNNIAQVNAHKFSNGDNLYFKAGTKLQMTDRLYINWHGSKNDRVIIGAYHGNGLFGLGGDDRPVLDGNKSVPDNINKGLIHHIGPGFITVQDVHVKNSYGSGISILEVYHSPARSSMKNIVRNCIVTDSGRQGILFARNSYGLIENNFVDGTSQTKELLPTGNMAYSGAAIEVSGMSREDVSQHNTVRGNTVRRNSEGIGIYKGARFTIIENNTVYDMAGNGIYAANARDGIIRNNLVYGIDPQDSKNHLQPHRGRRQLIWIDAEGHVKKIIKVTGGWEIYGNYLAGGAVGIWIQSNGNNAGAFQINNKIYNNRIVDCNKNFWIQQAVEGWKGNEIYNNYSFIFTPNLVHIKGDASPVGVTWSGNYFNSDVSGNAAQSRNENKISLQKKNSWRNLVPGEVTKEYFRFENESSYKPLKRVSNIQIVPNS